MATKPAPADPLADLRQEPDAAPLAVTDPDEQAPAEVIPPEPHDQTWHDAALVVMLDGWHNDETATSYLHASGGCVCRYIARNALKALHGDPVEDDDPED